MKNFNILDLIDTMKKENGVVGLKLSFEDEGASLQDLFDIIQKCSKSNIETTVKIGGCEAKTDIINCNLLGVTNIVAPMIETEFSFNKFKRLSSEVCSHEEHGHKFFVNIETKTAIKNFQKILNSNENFLTGVVIGRSDLSASYKINKSEVDNEQMYKVVKSALILAKKHGLTTAIGGNLSINSENFIKKLYKEKLLDRIETRLVISCLNESVINNFSNFINNAILLEKYILNRRISKLESQLRPWKERLKSIDKRTSFFETVQKREKNTIVIDFDNVIHEMDKGFHDGTIYGELIKGAEKSIKYLSENFNLIVFSCKCNPDRPLVNGKTGKKLIEEWLKNKGILKYISEITFEKPNAVAYIDDKAIKFENWTSCIEELKKNGIVK